MHSVLESELRDVSSLQNSINLAFFTLMVGLAVGFGTVLLTSHSSLTDRVFAIYAGLLLTSAIGSIYFGVKARIDRIEAQAQIDAIILGKKSHSVSSAD